MQEFRSLHLQKNLGEVLASAVTQPVVLLNRGQPRAVIMSAEEFRRLKMQAGEAVPEAAMPRQAAFVRRSAVNDDPLGYDTTDIVACARLMAENALSGRNLSKVGAELDRARRMLRPATHPGPASNGIGR